MVIKEFNKVRIAPKGTLSGRFASILILFLSLFFCRELPGIELKKELAIRFDGEIQFFLLDGVIHRWSNGKIRRYEGDKNVFEKQILNRGQGPGDFLVVQNILCSQGKYYVWDRMLRRMSLFSPAWELLKMERLNLPVYSSLLGIVSGHYLMKWGTMDRRNKGMVFSEEIGILRNGARESMVAMNGDWMKGGRINHDRPHLLYALAGSNLYYADNREYAVYRMNLNDTHPKPEVVIRRKHTPLPWRDSLEDLQWDLYKKPENPRPEIYPLRIPPHFFLAADDDVVAVVTNEKILEKKTRIDFFRGEKYIGSVEIPFLYQQHLVFRPYLDFPPYLVLDLPFLYTFHYLDEKDSCELVRWRILFAAEDPAG